MAKGPKKGTVNNPKGKNQYNLGGAAKMVGSMIYNPVKRANAAKARNNTKSAELRLSSDAATYQLNKRENINNELRNASVVADARDRANNARYNASNITGVRDFFDTPRQKAYANSAEANANRLAAQEKETRKQNAEVLDALSKSVKSSVDNLAKAKNFERNLKKANNADAYEKRYLKGYMNQTKGNAKKVISNAYESVHSLFGNHTSKKR